MIYILTQFRRLWHWPNVKFAWTWGQIWKWPFYVNINITHSAFTKETQRGKHLSCSFFFTSDVISGNLQTYNRLLTLADLWSLDRWPKVKFEGNLAIENFIGCHPFFLQIFRSYKSLSSTRKNLRHAFSTKFRNIFDKWIFLTLKILT